jgi:hypothetical protein
MADTVAPAQSGEMKRTLTLTGVTVNGMALIAPGAFLWTTFQEQAAQTSHGVAIGQVSARFCRMNRCARRAVPGSDHTTCA